MATFSATATDIVDVTDPAVFMEGNTVFSIGTHTITASATDAAGNPASETFTIKVQDTTAPDTSIITEPASLTSSTSATFNESLGEEHSRP